jgi:MtfA peptidase
MESIFLIIPVLLFLLILFIGLKHLGQRNRWSKVKSVPFTPESRQILKDRFPPYQYLSSNEKERLESKITYFLLHKRFIAAGDLKLTPEMKLLIAAHACLMIINLDLPELYPGLKNIYVMEGVYVEKDNSVNPHNGLLQHVPRLGESWKRGPIVLSWDSIEQVIKYSPKRHNLIIHEFSHHLDQQDGHFDGTPELETDQRFDLWAKIMGKEFKRLQKLVMQQKKTDIDAYGATNEAEFFAVCCEYFFTDPVTLAAKHPEIFRIYLDYFQIDPRAWHLPSTTKEK